MRWASRTSIRDGAHVAEQQRGARQRQSRVGDQPRPDVGELLEQPEPVLRRRPSLGRFASAGMRQRRDHIRERHGRSFTEDVPIDLLHRLVDLRRSSRQVAVLHSEERQVRQAVDVDSGMQDPGQTGAVLRVGHGRAAVPRGAGARCPRRTARSVGTDCRVGRARTRVRRRLAPGQSFMAADERRSSRTAERKGVPSGRTSSSPCSARDVQWLMLCRVARGQRPPGSCRARAEGVSRPRRE